jgi:hypothetical protein
MPVGFSISFDGKNELAQAFAEEFGGDRITAISEETAEAIRAAVARSIREGIPTRRAAIMLRAMVGMNARQAQAALNYHATLVDSGLSAAQIEKQMARYEERKIRERAMMIARTETMEALNAGAEAGYLEAQDEGLLSDKAEKEVIVTPDEALCEVCAGMDGERAAIGENFSIPGPPFHTSCRCTFAVTEA